MTTDNRQYDQTQDVSERLHAAEDHMTPAQHRPRYGQPFWPVTVFGSSMYILATVIALIVLSIIHPADSFVVDPNNQVAHPADPLNHEHVNPRPEWYFLFLFQVLKIFGGKWELIGTAVIPAVLGLILIGLPFYDRNWSRRAVRRPVAVTSAFVAIFGLAFLTWVPITNGVVQSAPVIAHPKFADVENIFKQNCAPCHVGYSGAPLAGLNLQTYSGVMAGGLGPALYPGLPKKVIVPGNPSASFLYNVVNWSIKSNQGQTMPLGKSKLPQSDIQNIYNWIKDGAPK